VKRLLDLFRADPVTLEEFGYLVGQNSGLSSTSKSGVTVGAKSVLGISAWYSGVRWIAEQIAGLPCPTYRDSPDGRQRRADPSWKRQPGPETPWFSWVEFALMSLLHKGNSYSFKDRNQAGQVVWLLPIHPDRVKPGQSASGMKLFQIDGREDLTLTSREILHIPGLSYDGVVGLNPIQYQADTLGGVMAANNSAATFFKNGDLTNAYLTFPNTLTKDQANSQQAVWEAQHSGLVNAHRIAVLGGGAEYKTIGLDPEQTQLLESRKFGVTDVARILRLTPQRLYDLERATFSNIEQQAIMDVQDGILPWCRRIEEHLRFDRDLTAPKTFHEFNVDGLLRGDFKARMEGYATGVNAGILTPAGVRAKENLPHIEGSDVLFQPLNFRTVGPDAVPLEEDPDASAP
jgi:HK97 family phage portal protein